MNYRCDASKSRGVSLPHAKRTFLASLILFLCLTLITIWLLSIDREEPQKMDLGKKQSIENLSLLEQAYLFGEMQALSEHPSAMPDYEDSWGRKVSERAILNNNSLKQWDDVKREELIDRFNAGYKSRFDEYYDPKAARAFGYRQGLKLNPEIHGKNYTDSTMIKNSLAEQRARLEADYGVADEAAWNLFVLAFTEGFLEGYWIVKDGVTLHPDEDFEFFDD